MNKTGIFLSALLLMAGCATRTGSNYEGVIKKISVKLANGDLSEALNLADSLKRTNIDGSVNFMKADSLAQIAERIAIDFCVTEDEVKSQIEKKTGSFSKEEKNIWEEKGWLEYRILDGRKMYFNRAVSNMNLLRKFYSSSEERQIGKPSDPESSFRLKHTTEVMRESSGVNDPVVPVEMRIIYTITVDPDVVPEGEIIRCWLPWPRSDQPRQDRVMLLAASQADYTISPDSAIHSTVYMEKPVQKGMPAVFQITYSYRSKGQYFNPEAIKSLAYEKSSEIFRKYTAEELPQINLSSAVRHLADSIAGNEKDPRAVVRKIYLWFKENIPWAGALEYSIMPDIPEYVLKNKRGDCGMQTFLFMSMLRSQGIPVRWQSGWMVPPDAENLHDWCEVYYEGTGWVPADISYDLQPSEKPEEKEFYKTGIDAYRLIVNAGVSGRLYPEKKYFRSEPFDFQRGEVEWKGGNIYFDKWNYDMKIEYLK